MNTPAYVLGSRSASLILKSILSPGDAVMLTAAVRDISHPGRFV
jgi:hypothetical protein